MLDPVPRRYIVCSHLFLPRCHRPSPSEEWVGFPRFVPRITTSRRPVFRGCRYSLMFRPPSLLSPQIVPTAAILPQGSRGFYVRAYRALLPPHAPDMLTVRVQVIDGTGTFTLSDSQPCRLLTSLLDPLPQVPASGRGEAPRDAATTSSSSPPCGNSACWCSRHRHCRHRPPRRLRDR